MKNFRQYQRGVTLVVALIMLILLTLLVVTSLNLNKSSLQTVSNMQQRNEAYNAAQEAIDRAVSDTRFFTVPNNVFISPCNGVANTLCIDLNGDGAPDITVNLTPAPTCVKVQPVASTQLSLQNADGTINTDDLGCTMGQQQNFGTVGAVSSGTGCSDSVWEIHAQATDNVTQAKVELTQGVNVRVPNDAIATSCP